MADSNPWMKWWVGDWRKNPKLKLLSAEARGVWLESLCAMHELNACEMTGTVRELSKMAGVEKDEMERAIAELEKYGVADIEWDRSGTLPQLSLVSRRRKREDESTSYERERKKKYRESIKENDSSQSCPTNVPLSDSVSVSVSASNKRKKVSKSEIEALYQHYPKKVGKRAALVAITKAIERIADRVEDPVKWMDERVALFARSPVGQGSFCPHPSTWFNQDRFDDDVGEWQKTEKKERPKWGETDKVAKSRSCCVCGGKATHSYQTKNYCEQHDQYSK